MNKSFGQMTSGDKASGVRRTGGRGRRGATVALAILGGLALAACGSNGNAEQTTTVPTTIATTTTTSTTTSTTTTTTTSTTTTTTTAAPAKSSGGSLVRLGTIEIPSIGVSQTIYEGVKLWIFDHGVGHWPGTAKPGQTGNVVLGGHRTSGIKPFRNIDQLQPGDTIRLTTDAGSFIYSVSKTVIVDPVDGMWITNSTPTATVTLFACHPPGSTKERIVVFGDYVGVG